MGIRIALVPLLAAALLLTGCATASPSGAAAEAEPAAALEIIADLGVDTSDPAAIIEGLDTLPVANRPSPDDLIASVQPGELLLQPGDVSLPLTGTDFYLSIAPYVEQTHPCAFHSLTTCLGELQRTPIELTVTDVKTGDVVVNEITATADNGFVGVWLPRDGEFDVRIVGEQGAAEQRVTTGAEDPTCLTTMQLAA
ncbi:CueP family metal-binding protein [Leucobacter albus]|uniref:CueP family metal-binding protein n=1 Tax=Leucobacter albus TaxID=272210 RepID=A0ABW3TMZ9_9MICO